MATTGIAPELLHPWVSRHFFKRLLMDAVLYPQLANVEDLSTAYYDQWQMAGLGTFRTKQEGAPVSYDDPVQSDRKRTLMQTYALGFRATMEMMEDDQYGIIRRMAEDLAESARDHQERLFWGLLNDGYTGATYTGIPERDGTQRSLFNTAHQPLKGTGTTSNRLNPYLPLSVAGIEAATTNLELTTSQEGRFSAIIPRVLVIHPNERWNAETILESTQEPGTGNNAINPVNRLGLTVLRVPYKTDPLAWELFAEKSKHTLTFLMRKGLTTKGSKDSQSYDNLEDAHYRANVDFGPYEGGVGSAP